MKAHSLLFALIISLSLTGQNLKPYILGVTTNASMPEAKEQVHTALTSAGFTVVGEYQPASDENRWAVVIAHPKLDRAVKEFAGLRGFASTLRVAITKENGQINVSYTNPFYWGNAYFQEDYPKVEETYKVIAASLKTALAKVGAVKNTPFGSKKGESADDLQDYHYMFGMPYFDETVELGSFSSTQKAVAHIDGALKAGKPGVSLVYKHAIPGTDLVLYGIALNGSEGESKFLPIIDLSSPKHTAFLPYELLVKNGEVHMLHGRYRIALSFPDLTMGTFTKIMSTPGDVEELLSQLTK